ncbi:hypothetical protein BCR44DRAFT_1443872 [Catenaria anguillulae PL171]|uniref:Uncharacterized protein n=1 Tax=Catenaria anguillulae PL171 TaxID=765915 RepID=A0A1Y2HAU2_9FUNG|nr:hypothetical protein BCR44DRAFT_1443872 [Catenaria anguillulae PL171]
MLTGTTSCSSPSSSAPSQSRPIPNGRREKPGRLCGQRRHAGRSKLARRDCLSNRSGAQKRITATSVLVFVAGGLLACLGLINVGKCVC